MANPRIGAARSRPRAAGLVGPKILNTARAGNKTRPAGFGRIAGTEERLRRIRAARERHGNGLEHLACDLEGAVFEIDPAGENTPISSVRIGFSVGNLHEIVAGVGSAGGRIVSPPRQSPWGLRAVVEDPDGHRVDLTETESVS